MSGQNKQKLVYIIEDESDIAELIRYSLSMEGYRAECFYTGEEGLQALQNNKPDLIMLDLMLPGMSGMSICRKIRENPQMKTLPIIMVTAKGEEADIVQGLELGADDYITKPFSPKVLTARIGAVLRRFGEVVKKPGDVLEFGELCIHPGRHIVSLNDEKIDLTRSEFQILHTLARKPGWVFTRAQIVESIRGSNFAVTDRTIDFQMVGLRKKLGVCGSRLETVRGVGYRFKES